MIEIESLTYRYPEGKKAALNAVNLSVSEGDFLVIRGLSGSGKTTLLRSVNGIVPHFYGGRISGSVSVDGLSTRYDMERIRKTVGLLFQDPENQIVMSSVKQEIAFGMENLNFERSEILRRIEYWADALGISHLSERRTTEISGGEKQRVLLASILAPGPKYLLLDEPASRLDNNAADALIRLLRGLNREGVTLLLSTHGREKGSRQFCMEGGAEADCSRIDSLLKGREPVPSYAADNLLLQISGFSASYNNTANNAVGSKKNIINNANLDLHAGEVIGLTGINGSGKSTLLKGIMGLPRVKTEGIVKVNTGRGMEIINELSPASRARYIAYLGQYPGAYLFHDTLEEEVLFSLRNMNEGDADRRTHEILDRLFLMKYRHTNPRDLSTGEKERAALASVLVSGQRIILLDEPTRGMDPAKRLALVNYLSGELRVGKGVIVASHDRELLRLLSAETYELRNGELIRRGRYNG